MPDEPRPSSGHASNPPSDRRAFQAQRHPALRARLGDISEEDLSAFAVRPSAPQAAEPQAEAEAPPAQATAQAPRTRTRRSAQAASSGAGGRTVRRRSSAKERQKARKKFVLLVVLPCALAAGLGWAATSPRFQVAGVDVEGIEATPPARVQAIWAALRAQNWVRADLGVARSRLVKLPTVQSADVSRAWNSWPPRLSVRIHERRPWLRLGGGGSWWIVDRSGVAFRRATRHDRALYPITATEFDPEALRVGQKVPPQIWTGVRRLALALDESSKNGEPWQIKRAYLDRDSMASLRLRGGSQDGLLVRLGDGLWPQKMERARRALVFFEAAGRRAQSLNLVSFSMPTWTPLQPRPATLRADSNNSGAASDTGQTPASDTANAASNTPTDTSNTASENAASPAASTSGNSSTWDGAGGADDAAANAVDDSSKRGEPDGADESA